VVSASFQLVLDWRGPKLMKIVATIARIIMGCVFVFFGLNIFFQFLHMPPPPSGPAGDFAKALFVSHYIYVVGGLQVVGGLLCLLGRFVPLALILLGPVIVNILLFHLLLNPTGLPMAIAVSVLALIVLWYHRAAFSGLLKSGAPGQG
jgi:putative oxidoreductase